MKFVIAILIAVGIFLMWKKTEWKKVVKIILTVVLGLVLIGCLLPSSNDDSDKAEDKKPKAQQEQTAEEETKEEEPAIEYVDVTTDELSDALDANAMNASETYKDKYFAVTGRLSNIDASGKYISLVDINDELSFNCIQCNIKSDEQLEKVKKMTTGDTVTVRGKITDVGEFLGYTMDIDSID